MIEDAIAIGAMLLFATIVLLAAMSWATGFVVF